MYNQCVPQAATYLPQSCQITKVWQMTVPVLVEFGGLVWFPKQKTKKCQSKKSRFIDKCSAMCQSYHFPICSSCVFHVFCHVFIFLRNMDHIVDVRSPIGWSSSHDLRQLSRCATSKSPRSIQKSSTPLLQHKKIVNSCK